MVYTRQQEMFGWTSHGTAKRYGNWVLSDQTGLGIFLQPWYSYSAVGGQQVPSTALHHTTLQFTHYSLYINLNISRVPIITAF